MTRRLFAATLVAISPLAIATSRSEAQTRHGAAAGHALCSAGYVHAVVGGRRKCLRAGEPTHSVTLLRRTRTTGCRVRGVLPDRRCSPGAIYSDATLGRI